MTKNYGTNNPAAWEATCYNGQKHDWKEVSQYKTVTRYVCQSCKSTTSVDSGD